MLVSTTDFRLPLSILNQLQHLRRAETIFLLPKLLQHFRKNRTETLKAVLGQRYTHIFYHAFHNRLETACASIFTASHESYASVHKISKLCSVNFVSDVEYVDVGT